MQVLNYIKYNTIAFNDIQLYENYYFEVDPTLEVDEIGVIIQYMYIDETLKDV